MNILQALGFKKKEAAQSANQTSDSPELRAAVRRFIDFADAHPEMTFLVTRIGCGIAGYRDEEIAPMFARAYSLPNVHLPESFWRVLSYKF